MRGGVESHESLVTHCSQCREHKLKSPASPPGFNRGPLLRRSGRLQIAGSLLAALGQDLVAPPLALDQRTHASALHRGDVHEDVLRAIFRLDEAVAFLGIEELHSSDGHSVVPFTRLFVDRPYESRDGRQQSEFWGVT